MVYFETGNRSFWNINIFYTFYALSRWFYKDIRMCVMHLYANDALIEQTMVSIFAMCQSLADDSNTYNQLSINCFWFIVFIYFFLLLFFTNNASNKIQNSLRRMQAPRSGLRNVAQHTFPTEFKFWKKFKSNLTKILYYLMSHNRTSLIQGGDVFVFFSINHEWV